MEFKKILSDLGVDLSDYIGKDLEVTTPIDGSTLSSLRCDNVKDYAGKVALSKQAFQDWRDVPAPKRGELIRIFSEELRHAKDALGALVTLECGKILEEGKGEVQEMIDICDYAVGLSRIVGGKTFPSERVGHVMHENWYPLGIVGVISAFNFPVAVWAWNFALAIICGNTVIWKPSEKTPLCALACQAIFERAVAKFLDNVPEGLSQVVLGNSEIGNALVNDSNIALVSATGSCRMGSIVGPKVAGRFGRSLLELGGNNACVVTSSADLSVAIPSLVFGAVGTAGQRCTTTRRVFVHASRYDEVFDCLNRAYESLLGKVGNPLNMNILVGPLIDGASLDMMLETIREAKKAGGHIFYGEQISVKGCEGGNYVQPCLVKIKQQADIVKKETFAPIMYVMPYQHMDELIEVHNAVSQGLSSAIFTTDLREAEYFKQYSDCGICNVNIGTSGAEIGGAFGGEKETGGGRESGSDAWKAYMRRQTSTTYYGEGVPELAQGIKFS